MLPLIKIKNGSSRFRFLLSAQCLLLSQPGLRAAHKRNADIAAYIEFFIVINHGDLAAVEFAIGGIKDFAAVVLLAVFLEAKQDRHAYHWLVLILAIAFVALGIFFFIFVEKELLNLAV